MRGACDDSREIYRIIKKHKKTSDFYIHVDGALSGFFIPFLESDTFFKARSTLQFFNLIQISLRLIYIPFPFRDTNSWVFHFLAESS
jgi:glutamate/tyrosine decarboxylase-like PLP-dependent enzyme